MGNATRRGGLRQRQQQLVEAHPWWHAPLAWPPRPAPVHVAETSPRRRLHGTALAAMLAMSSLRAKPNR